MTFKESIQSGFKRCMDFSGRSSRSEYWYWVLFTLLLTMALSFIGVSMNGNSLFDGLIWLLFAMVHISVAVRRLHDLDKSGWWLLLGLIPLLGAVVLLFWFVQKGTEGSNRFGADPLNL